MQTFLRVLAVAIATVLFSAVALPFPALGASTSPSPTPSTTATAPAKPNPAATSKNLTFGIGPAVQVPSDHLVDGRPYISAESKPGGVVRDAVALFNLARTPITVQVYPADAAQNGSSTFQLSLINQKVTQAGSWFTLNGQRRLTVTIPASHAAPNDRNIPGRVLIPFEARIPLDATPGDHAAAIVAELDAKARNGDGANVTLQQRLGVSVYFHLASQVGTLRSALRVSNLRAHWDEPGGPLGTSRYTVTFTVRNVGDVRLNVSTLIGTTRWFLPAIHSYPEVISNLFPGGSATVTKTVTGVFGLGPWHVTATAFGSPADPTQAVTTTPAAASLTFWPWPWVLIAIIVGTILALYLLWRGYRRWRRLRAEKQARLEAEKAELAKAQAKIAQQAAELAKREARKTRAPGWRTKPNDAGESQAVSPTDVEPPVGRGARKVARGGLFGRARKAPGRHATPEGLEPMGGTE
ncbi:hypothetical protein Back2_12700 [Nocardioides baekrokdamisoli]|uniref:DUF916 domain-containing protein n=1 Tax=Nocardioides baekrokdamisoli TaxID=1804624 RepID=A0A3G9IX75_9ACTN|nr:hypothetical protein [Nocardioides baekrokdamisoli]BBH16983.1 hypothetical protein Back2_12700 [Nocardioides baekrokdamisoli]